VTSPQELPSGARAAKAIVSAWAAAMAEALDGFSFGDRVKGDVPGQPRGYWTTELEFHEDYDYEEEGE